MKTPFFSVIIHTLNEEKYLPNLLNSLKKQTYKDFEIIILDANSQDKTTEIAQLYKTKFPVLKILKKKKSTLPHHRNIAASKTKGRYLVFLEADVILKPGI